MFLAKRLCTVKYRFLPPLLAAFFWLAAATGLHASAQTQRNVLDFDTDWKFAGHDAPGAEAATFDDGAWRSVSVPHDWSIAGPVAQTNATGPGGGFFPNGVGWYRKDFSLPAADAHRRVYIVFDGVMANSDVWINGFHLGQRPNGYVSFFYDLTGHVQTGTGARNVLAVRCDNSQQPASRWYEGAGIYRPVRLVVTDGVHIAPWGTVVTTPSSTVDETLAATIHVRSSVINESATPANVTLSVSLIGPDGRMVKKFASGNASLKNLKFGGVVTLAAGATANLDAETTVPNPDRWDLSHPALYTARVTLLRDGKPVDNEEVAFGIREFHFDADTGFWLNGRNFKLKGAAMHIDGGAVGIAVPTAVYERRLLALRALGVNAIRTAHNPPSPEFLDLCDRLGFLVMEEMFDQWTVAKNPFDYHLYFRDWSLRDTADTVRRDRNHPSIILWSAGNEIHDTPHPEIAIPILKSLVDTFHANDITRPVTQALFRPNVSHDYDNGLADLLDVIGQNYREQEILAAHAQKPTRKIVGTENTHDRNQWIAMRDHPEYSGQFLWVGVDYLGEAGQWPRIVNGAGLLDRTARPRAVGFERESWWLTAPNIHIARRIEVQENVGVDPGYQPTPPRFRQTSFLDWTPQNPAPHTESVEVYTNCEEAELVLNGASLGRQKLHPDATPLIWKVAYAPGLLKAVGYNKGVPVAVNELRTAGPASKLVLTPAQKSVSPTFDDLDTIEVAITDSHGVVVPTASSLIQFTVSGPGAIVAVDNGSFTDHDSFQAGERHAFGGRAIALVRATAPSGEIRVTATAPGLASATVTIGATPTAAKDPVRSF